MRTISETASRISRSTRGARVPTASDRVGLLSTAEAKPRPDPIGSIWVSDCSPTFNDGELAAIGSQARLQRIGPAPSDQLAWPSDRSCAAGIRPTVSADSQAVRVEGPRPAWGNPDDRFFRAIKIESGVGS
jgi:hypothetical protein